ncbi:aminoimidazole riboside kinase [Alteribacillus bidgolensis]|uniref:Fructokinase n=1 Tax=Alteribacillus bidgolensis TaxID=930129 RepID=A0A1G8ER48_9BACI|nr:aminoimidazole riboside kinase [Alteribacillus bidgolensis]SDH72336.1 fructokinase [Alteribacillus bidgolensis]
MKNGVISLGEALIDFIPMDEWNTLYQKSPGGAPANVAVGLSRLGINTYFLGKLGEDVLGTFLYETLQQYGVKTDHLYLTDEARTGAVFVTLDKSGERSFNFYINPSADQFLHPDEIDERLFEQAKVLHFGSITLINEPARSATLKAIKLAKKHSLRITFDPNVRLPLWPTEKQARETILHTISHADVVKISEDELEFLTGETEEAKGTAALDKYQIPVLVITKGEHGSTIITKNGQVDIEAESVKAVDTTGAGDAYLSGLLYHVHKYDDKIEDISLQQWQEAAAFASLSGGLAASAKGAMSSLPTLKEIEKNKDT